MPAIYLELGSDCPRCLQRVPMNAITRAVACPRCGAELRAEPHAILGQVVAGREGQVGMFGSTGGIEGRFGTLDAPACERCGAPVDMERALTEGSAPCTRCDGRLPVRAVPPELALRVPEGVTHVVGERFDAALAKDGITPLVQRFYLWIDPHAQARVEAARQAKLRRRGAWWLVVGLVLFAAGAFVVFRLWAGAWQTLMTPGGLVGAREHVVLWGGPLALLLGAMMLPHGGKRFWPSLEVVLGLLGLALLGTGGVWLYLEGMTPWALVAAGTGFSWLFYLLRNVIPSV